MNAQLKVIDYLIIFLAIIVSAVIGIYFGCIGSKQKTARDYIYGESSLKALPIGLSIFSSSLSGIGMLGIPSEIYVFGIQYFIHIIGAYLSLILICKFILPVFNGTQKFKAPYEYYEQRFNKTIRIVSSLIYVVQASLIIPIILYSCSLLISEATDIHLIACSSILGIICIMYTLLGGFIAVIWTDVLQAFLMFTTLICLGIVSVSKAGGFNTIWTISEKGGRINFFDFDPNPFKRLSFWSAIFGTMTNFVGHQGCSASILQRYLSVKTEKEARTAIFIGISGIVCNTVIGSIIGLSMYSMYHGCDPIANNELKNYNQLTSDFALNMVKYIPGLIGILISGLLSAGLSSMSSELNTISGIVYYDIIQNYFHKFNSDKNDVCILKLLVLIFGVYFILMVLVVQKIKYLIPVTMMFSGTTSGLKLGLLILGTTFPKANSIGALCGILTAGIVMSWIAINATINNVGSLETLPVSTDNCTYLNGTFLNGLNNTIDKISTATKSEPFFVYKLSFLYYNLFGAIITITVALIVSYAVGVNDFGKMDPKLFIPIVRPKKTENLHMDDMHNMLMK